MRQIYAPKLSNGAITATLQPLDYLITERGVIEQQTANVY
jgi:hypothetical protein